EHRGVRRIRGQGPAHHDGPLRARAGAIEAGHARGDSHIAGNLPVNEAELVRDVRNVSARARDGERAVVVRSCAGDRGGSHVSRVPARRERSGDLDVRERNCRGTRCAAAGDRQSHVHVCRHVNRVAVNDRPTDAIVGLRRRDGGTTTFQLHPDWYVADGRRRQAFSTYIESRRKGNPFAGYKTKEGFRPSVASDSRIITPPLDHTVVRSTLRTRTTIVVSP